MPIVPVYRLRATSSEPYPRYRFSRDAHPDPNPQPGQPNPDPKTRWCVDRVAFYAWTDPLESEQLNDKLLPVYEFYRVDSNGLVRYLYSAQATPPEGWTGRQYAAFWGYPPQTGTANPPVYFYSQRIAEGANYALSVNPRLSTPWKQEGILALAATTIPVEVSVRQDAAERRYHWSYTPSTVNLSYRATIQFVQAPLSDWRFTSFEVLKGGDDFDPPAVTDRMVLLNARYLHPGADFKYRITIDVFNGPDRLVGDPEMANQTPDVL